MTLRERIEDAFLAVLETTEPEHLPAEFTIRVPFGWTKGHRVQAIRVGGYTVHVESEPAFGLAAVVGTSRVMQ